MTKRLEADDAEIEKVLDISNQCRVLLRGHPPTRQGAVIVELLSTWLAGFFAPHLDHPERGPTDGLRELMLDHTIDAVRKLIPEQEKLILETREGRKVWSSPLS